ncbi:TPA: hypothetical protein N0F65_011528 [Lagenidium giganteum]|uniref:Uncharacterized protein n=1 Tax=Lagenidium giganteum TaxID=4803 RepID=A0AAV2Z7Z5_9STRA|nr:TPA: hypothetical protein N0F65_011528 [Lagenidium giganteum]
MSTAFGGQYMVMPPEAEQLIESQIVIQPVESIGQSAAWLSYHHVVEKLNLQAHQSAQHKQDNFVVEALLTYNKYPTLLTNLLALELWKTNVFPLVQAKNRENASMRLYFILYHEATLSNLLEVAFYHEHVVESLDDDLMLEVVDYCVRKLTWLISLPRSAIAQQTTFHKSGSEIVEMMRTQSPANELARQQMEIEFRIAVQCVTILRYVAERLHLLPLSIVSRLMDTHDVLLSLVVLVENPPWTHKVIEDGTEEVRWKKFSHQKWKFVEPSDLLVLTTTEAQVWLAIYYLLCTQSAREHYQITQYRKDQLLRVRKYLNDLLLDQLPLLTAIQRYLDELSLVQAGTSVVNCGSLVMETVPYARDALIRKYRKSGEYQRIAETFDTMSESLQRTDDLRELAQVYQMEGIEELLDADETALRMDTKDEDNKDGDVSETEEMPVPQSVRLVVRNTPPQKKKALIVEIDDENDNNQGAPNDSESLQPTLVIDFDVDFSNRKLLESRSSRYYRYPLVPTQDKLNRVPVHSHAAVDVHVRIDHIVTSTDSDTTQLKCPDLELPSNSSGKIWKQIGSLEDASPMILLCQFVPSHGNQSDDDRAVFELALRTMFLSVPC